MSIKTKILIPMLVLTILVVASILISNILLFSNYVDDLMLNEVKVAAGIAAYELDILKGKAQNASLYMSEYSEIVRAIGNGDREALLVHATRLQHEMDMEFCTISDSDGVVIVRTHEPDNYGDSILGQANIRSALSGQYMTAIESGTAVRLSVRSGAPVYDSGGNLIGVVSVGTRLDRGDFVDALNKLLNCEVTIFLDDERISTTVLNNDGTLAIGTKLDESISQGVLAGSPYIGRTDILGQSAFASYDPIYGPDGRPIGILFVGQYTNEKTSVILAFVQSGVLITLVLLAISVVLVLAIIKHITKPLTTISGAAEALALGNIEIEGLDSGTEQTRDEILMLERSFSKMLESFKKQAYILTRVAEGDYTSKVEIRSEKDVINLSIELMLNGTLEVLNQVASAGIQVAEGSKNISDGAQHLADGAMKQTEAVEELSRSISYISEKTRANEQMAEEAVKNSDIVRNVIRIIDSIASQTNIIALNASVEAARAGQHGNAFAIVAEEVRNLALKSKTSLVDIETGINESIRIIDEIAKASKEQSVNIEQINSRIRQVTQIVQQNSATAEESAAASHQMSSQSKVLEDLIMQFQLRDQIKKAKR